ncbi:SUKH-4 family immunity protein [Streptomyces sp. NPDC047860]|uniref:SUKH-4 family immunity protein n=1 Tax=Streptomyces sp. NPDC047860 TaxID=3155743 RepID=UPI0033CEF6A9
MDVDLVNIEIAQDGATLTVPSEFFSYRSLDVAEKVQAGSDRSLIRFGLIGLKSSIYFDQDSGEVLHGLNPEELGIVNTTISRFTECIVRVAEMFPFYDEGSDVDEWEAGAQRVEDVIGEVDPSAYRDGAFWYEFRWDVSMGDFHE